MNYDQNLSVEFGERDFSPGPGLDFGFTVDSLSWADPGGPDRAVLRAAIPPQRNGLEVIEDLLRRPVTVRTSGGDPCWWGYVHAGQAGALGWDLGGLASRVAVQYTERHPDLAWLGEARFTAWAEDAAAVQGFGRKERRISLPEATPNEAVQARDAWLARLARPQAVIQTGHAGSGGVVLDARGWWDTLDWVYYGQSAGLVGYTRAGQSTLTPGSSTSSREFCQCFGVEQAWKACELWLAASRSGSPGDDLLVDLVRWSGAGIAETLASISIPAADLPNGREWVRLELPEAESLLPGLTYGMRVRRSGALSSAAYVQLGAAEAGDAPGTLWEWNGSSWLPSTKADVMLFQVVGKSSTLEQAADLLRADQAGQFLAGVKLPEGGSQARLYRAGDRTALAELLDLLAAGDGSGRPLTARVTPERWLVIEPAEDESSAGLVLGASGEILDGWGRPLPLGQRAAGRWAKVGERAVWLRQAVWSREQGLRAHDG